MNSDKISSVTKYIRAFVQIGKQLFKEYGFQYGNDCFYRKNSNVFQAFSLIHPGCIALTVAPYWCDLKTFDVYDETNLSSSIRNGLFKPSSFAANYYYYDSSLLSLEELGDELKHFAKIFIKELDGVNDERTYINYLNDKKRFFDCSEDAILFVSYVESNAAVALNWVNQLNSFSLNEYIWNLDKIPQETLFERTNEKQCIDRVFFNNYWRNVRHRFPKLYAYVTNQNSDLNIESFYEKEAVRMKNIYSAYFKLKF